jgi:hypothetical protein
MLKKWICTENHMTGRNNGDVAARMALFYVCDPGAPFADPVA